MKTAQFFARCDLEIGDEVIIPGLPSKFPSKWLIHDIRAIHYVSSGNVEFEFQLKSDAGLTKWLKRSQIIYPVPKDVVVK